MSLKLFETKNFKFDRGINTETSPLLRPEGTSIDELNFIIKRDGSRQRRWGWKKLSSDSKVPYDTGLTSFPDVNVIFWDNPGSNYSNGLFVLRIGNYLYFHASQGDNMAGRTGERIDLRNHRIDRTTSAIGDTEFTEGSGYLFVTGEDIYPLYLSYESITVGTTSYRVVAREINVRERDLEGVEDGFGVSTHPTINDSNHEYNLFNQGWNSSDISTYFASYSYYPSNAQIRHFGMYTLSSGLETFDPGQLNNQDFGNVRAPRGKFIQHVNFHNHVVTENYTFKVTAVSYVAGSPNRIRITHNDTYTHTATAFVYLKDIYLAYKDSSGIVRYITVHGYHEVTNVVATSQFDIDFDLPGYSSDFTWLSSESANCGTQPNFKSTVPGGFQGISKGFRAIAHHAGRLFYAGMDDQYRSLYDKRIFFSTISQNGTQFGECYSKNDPTSEHTSDPLDTDGGYIEIKEMGTVRKMISFGVHLIIFADNGIWSVVPGEDGYFTAINFGVQKISDISLTTKESIIYANGTIFFWGDGGIYAVTLDEVSSLPNVRSITDGVIKTLITEQTDPSASIHGTYDKKNNILYWLYGDGNQHSTWGLNRILVIDLTAGSIYKFSAPLDHEATGEGQYPLTLVYAPPLEGGTLDAEVNSNQRIRMLKADLDNSGAIEDLQWYVMKEDSVATSENDFVDESYVSRFEGETLPYLITSYEYGSGPDKKKWGKMVQCFFDRTEDSVTVSATTGMTLHNKSGCQLEARWDFADTDVSNKWGPSQQVYRLQRVFMPTDSAPGTYSWDNGYPVVRTRNKVRGSGNVINLKFTGETGKHCSLLGWTIDLLETSDSR